MTTLRVAVVGAGPSGLVTTKELLEAGHDPVCFERADGLGGVFRYDEQDGVVWQSCRLVSSGLVTAFSDYPVEAHRAGHLPIDEYVRYLEAYCDAFGVREHLRFGATVEAVARDGEGWLVRTRDQHGQHRDRFDAVAVCSGLHQHPHRPRFAGEETFTGRVIHGADYRRPGDLADKRVLVVGAGESGADIVAEVSTQATETLISLRRGVAVLPRLIRGLPNDYRTTRISNSSAPWVFETRNPADARQRNVYRLVFFPLVLLDKLAQVVARLGSRARAALTESRLERKTARLQKELLDESGGTLQEQFGTKTEAWVEALAAGRCRRVGAIERFDGPQVVFEDGETTEPDVVILCTGFDVEVPFLEPPELAAAGRYLHTFIPTVGPSLAFVGFVRPSFGAIPPLAELQARWFARLLTGACSLPAPEVMEVAIGDQTAFRHHYFRALPPDRLEYLVDFTSTCDAFAHEIGCKPTRAALAAESRAFRRRFDTGPFVSAQYRLVGPGAKPEVARPVVAGLPSAYPRHELAAFALRRALSRALHRLLGPRYAPKLELE